MANEKFTLTWHSYTNHFQEALSNLLNTGESSDVTLVCDDQVKFKAHKFILKSCSPVFESILNETNDSKSVVYLRGVNQLELKPILSFIYSGQASFYQERMKDFLKIGKDLQIKEIKEVPEEDGMADNGENLFNKNHEDEDLISEEVSRDDTDSVDKEFASSIDTNETSQLISEPSDSYQCPLCNVVFTHQRNLLAHVRYKHEGVKYPCSKCDHKAISQSQLTKHIKSVHEGVKYPCSQCDYKAKLQCNLTRHIESVHEGVKYPCSKCDYKATTQYNLKIHIESVHKGVKYPCSHCDYKATQQSNLIQHIKSKH